MADAGVTTRTSRRASGGDDVDGDEAGGSPDSRRSQLSIDDLSGQDGHEDESTKAQHKAKKALDETTVSLGLDNTKRVESKLKLNLKQQQDHYARQRQLFEEIQSDSILGRGLSPSQFSSSSKSDEDDGNAIGPSNTKSAAALPSKSSSADDALVSARSRKFQLQLQQLQRELTSTKANGRSRETHTTRGRPSRGDTSDNENNDDNDDDDDVEAIERLQRKAKSIATYHSRIAQGSGSSVSGLHYTRAGPVQSSRARVSRADDPLSQDASNEALRKQLELLRRLQLENNRFRHENRSLREQNDVLEEQSALHTREIKRLQDEVSDLTVRVQHDQMELATAAQNVRKMKQLQKQLTAVQSERDQLQQALQEAMDQDAQLRLRTQNEVESMVQETKHLKRSLKQAKQQEARLQEQGDELREIVSALEKEAAELKRQLLEKQRDSSAMASQLNEKTTQIEAIESSASQCVERMEAGMEALQKAHNSERDKRKKLEKLRDSLQNQVATLEQCQSDLQERVRELELFNSQLQQRIADWKQEQKHDKKCQDEKVAEFHERQRSDAKTITNLREECTTYEQQLEAARSAVVEVRKEVALESNALRKEVEALRNYIEDAQRAPLAASSLDSDSSRESEGISSVPLPVSTRQRREDLWVQLPELQFLQGAVGGLRNEMMNLVNDFHRARHHARQQAAKLTAHAERVVELEHSRSEDALLVKELKDQRVLAEQAREITLQEKMEILKWSQATCEKNEKLESELAKCTQCVVSLTKKLRRVRDVTVSADTEAHEPTDHEPRAKPRAAVKALADVEVDGVARVLSGVELEAQGLISLVEQLFEERNAKIQESAERQQRIVRLQKEIENQRQDHAATMSDVEALHARAVAEKQQLFSESLREMEVHKDSVEKALEDERVALATIQNMNEGLEKQLRELEKDVPVFSALLQLFTLVVPSLVLQVNDLLSQKRVLARENAEYAAAHEQVECIGQVLRELVPSAVVGAGSHQEESYAEQQRKLRKKAFRRVVVAVFAINRLQRGGFGGSANGTGETVYGVCTSLKPARKKKAATSCLPPQTVIKMLPPKPTLARLQLRGVLDRLKELDVPGQLGEALSTAPTGTSGSTSSSFGSLLMVVMTAIDPTSKELLVENTSGVFHCRALLERRKASRHAVESEDARLSTVDLIRKRILALGKRLEDLHYQRNSLQKENYEFQFQLEQQAAQLKDLDVAIQKNEAIQDEIIELQDRHGAEASRFETQLAEKDREIDAKKLELESQKTRIDRFEQEIASFETQISEMEVEKTELRHALIMAKAASAIEEEKLHKSRLGMDKQAEEVRNLRQAAKRAHEMHQKVTWQLEQELLEKANLQTMMEHLRRQKETLEAEVSKAKVRAVGASFDEDDDGNDDEREQRHSDNEHSRGFHAGSKTVEPSPSSSTSSYDRHLQELTDRIAQIRTATPLMHEANDDNGSSDDEEAAASQKHQRKEPREDSFRSEWQRLDISGVFEDGGAAPASPKLPHKRAGDHQEADSSNTTRRGLEIDKVNTAVHDYMDRIDEKLQQMYGIPRSANRQRPPTTDAIIHGSSSATTAKHTTSAATSASHHRAKKGTGVRWSELAEFD